MFTVKLIKTLLGFMSNDICVFAFNDLSGKYDLQISINEMNNMSDIKLVIKGYIAGDMFEHAYVKLDDVGNMDFDY